MFLVDLVLWFAVSLLCLRCLNKDADASKEWYEYPVWLRAIGLAFIPFIYLVVAGQEAFKK